MHLLAHGGMLPVYQPPAGEKGRSRRFKGVMQGFVIFLIGVVLVPILAIMANFAPGRLDNVFAFFAAISAIICFVGGPLRMLFAAIFEEGAPPKQFTPQLNYKIPPQSIPQARVSALPPVPAANPAGQWRQRPQTAEINPPASVTDSTTQLLDREPRKE